MCQQCERLIAELWPLLAVGQVFRTPDDAVGVPFSIHDVFEDRIVIHTEAGALVPITRAAFVAALSYLCEHGPDSGWRCEVRSNNDYELAGPLCRAARDVNPHVRGTRCITYILPILAAHGHVRIDGRTPNTTWATKLHSR